MNKIVNGKQCTILWHFIDLKISPVNGNVNEDILESLNVWYGKARHPTDCDLWQHPWIFWYDYWLQYSQKSNELRKGTMLKACWRGGATRKGMSGTAAAPAAALTCSKLKTPQRNSRKRNQICIIVSRQSYYSETSKRTWPDIQMPIAILCTWGVMPNVGDYKKLRRVLIYHRGT